MFGAKRPSKTQEQEKQHIIIHTAYADNLTNLPLDKYLEQSLLHWSTVNKKVAQYNVSSPESRDIYKKSGSKILKNISEKQLEKTVQGPPFLLIASIDPAIVNIGFRIEQRYPNGNVNTLVHCRLRFSKRKSSAQKRIAVNNKSRAKESKETKITKGSKKEKKGSKSTKENGLKESKKEKEEVKIEAKNVKKVVKKNPTPYSIQQEETLIPFQKLEELLLNRDVDNSSDIVSDLYMQANLFFDIYLYLLRQCHIIIIEKQLPEAYQNVRISQHIVSYLLYKVYDTNLRPWILEIDCQMKHKLLGCPKHLNKQAIKKWLQQKALDLCDMRDDNLTKEVINKATKKDDICDIICQVEAFCVYMSLPLSIKRKKIRVKDD